MRSILLVMCVIGTSSFAQTLPTKAVFYRPYDFSFFGRLADDSGASPTPRYLAVQTLNQNLYGFAVNQHANTVIFLLDDEDSSAGKWGGGFSYDPFDRKKPSFAVAQEIVVSIAQKYGMKVIFAINFSDYHKLTNDAFGYHRAGQPAGAWDYIHALIDPTAFYTAQNTTQLSTVGLTDHPFRSFIGDARIAGWYFSGEWQLEISAQKAFLDKYWGFFRGLVHYNGANTSFAGIYTQASPEMAAYDDSLCANETTAQLAARLGPTSACSSTPAGSLCLSDATPGGRIRNLKSYFYTAGNAPDRYGLEWYGSYMSSQQPYRLTCGPTDIAYLVRVMRDRLYSVPTQNIALMEGGTKQGDPANHNILNSAAPTFITSVINQAANVDGIAVSGVSVWASDTLDNIGSCQAGDTLDGQPMNQPDVLFSLTKWQLPFTTYGCRQYSPPPDGWHTNSSASSLQTTTWQIQIGTFYYSDQSPLGAAVAQAFGSH